uniref:DDE-1 domain-containing protein n=1 Tax=Rhizophagus irregularis (strain DAOM 181602 / DAOM 197198 / MUCL 43194) TaxID=747089 RepID=U9T480_RHIID
MAFKKHYRYYHIRWMLEQVEVGQLIQDLKMNVLQAIQYIIQSWDEISADTIQNCWNHTEILPNTFPLYDIYEDNIDDELGKVIEALNLHNRMQVKEFLTIPDENIMIVLKDDSTKVETNCINEALKSLKTVYTFLIQQENANGYMKLMDKIEKFIKREQINSMQQTTIDKYFR